MRTALALLLLTPLAVRPSGAAPFAYVSNEKAGNVTVVDLATDRPVAAMATGGRRRGIQVSADGKTLYVSRAGLERQKKSPLDAVLAIDVATRRVRAAYDVGSDPERFAVSRDGSRLYISNEDAGTATVTR